MKTLQERVKEYAEAQNRRYKKNYAYAKSLGFNALEARVVSKWSIARIKAEAEKHNKKVVDVGDE